MKSSDLARKGLEECIADSEKYHKIRDVLSRYIDDPDDTVQVTDLCVRAGSDETLDSVMDEADVSCLDGLMTKIQKWRARDMLKGVYLELDLLRFNKDAVTVDNYWECKCRCDRDFVHPKTESKCSACGALRDDDNTPDARRMDVIRYLIRRLARAKILCAMDVLVGHLSDEDAIEPWLADGLPDGMCRDILDPQKSEDVLYDYWDASDMSRDEFERMCKLFVNTIRAGCCGPKGEYEKGSFC